MDKKVMTISEAAEILGKSPQTIRRMIKAGILPAKRIKSPQGFHYVVEREGVEGSETMFSESPIQNGDLPQGVELDDVLTNQTQILTNQNPVVVHEDEENPAIDKNDAHHAEIMALIHILEKLQVKLDEEQRRPRSLLAHFVDWCLGH